MFCGGKNPEAYHALTITLHFLVQPEADADIQALWREHTCEHVGRCIFFCLYAANFETVQWIAASAYILALIFALEVLRLYKNVPLSRPQMLLAALYILLGILNTPRISICSRRLRLYCLYTHGIAVRNNFQHNTFCVGGVHRYWMCVCVLREFTTG